MTVFDALVTPAVALARPAASKPAEIIAAALAPQASPLGRDTVAFSSPASSRGGIGRTLLKPYLDYAAAKGAQRFMHSARAADGPTPDRFGLAYSTLHFTSRDGKTPLVGWYMPATQPTDKTIVLAHGWGGQQGSEVERFAKWLHDAGYNVLSFDFRNCGGSGGDRTTMGYEERGDLQAAIDQAVGLGAKRIAVLGRSMGAATALELAPQDPRINVLVDDCGFDTVYDAILPRVKRERQEVGPFKVSYPFPKLASEAIAEKVDHDAGEPVAETNPLDAINRLGDRPILIIHGAADDETLPEDSQHLFDADPGVNKELWIVPKATHGQSYNTDPRGYQDRVLRFLKNNL